MKIVGIDLGTTHSLVAHVREGVPEVLTSREGKRLVPSVVALRLGQTPVVGYAARALQSDLSSDAVIVSSIKRLMGRSFAEVESIAPNLSFPLDSQMRVVAGDRSYSAVEVSSMILRELKLSAEAALGESVSQAVVTVPAYFSDGQRQATRLAARLAGWDVLRMINEPTAAALAYGLDRKRQGLIAVYDLGGGTFDVSILKLKDGIFEVLSTAGDTALGGDDMDRAFAHALMESEPKLGKLDFFRIQKEAERAKIAFSDQERVTVTFSEAGYVRDWTRSQFELAIEPVLARTRVPCLQALKDAGLSLADLSDVVLVGGPTRLGLVQRTVEEIFGRKPNASLHPDEVVALGAAIQADILAGNNREMLLLDVVPLSLGIETYGGIMSPLIVRNTRIPAVARDTFTTFVEGQTSVDIHVLQGERDRVEDNRSLARFKLSGIEPLPAGLPRIEVSFLIDADGILQVSARDQRTGQLQSVEVRPTFGLTDSEVEQMLLASLENAEQDVAFRKEVNAKAELLMKDAVEKRISS